VEQIMRRPAKQGLVTIANHSSMLDDPLLWGTLPLSLTWRHRSMRWSMGAKEIMFRGRLDSAFFGKGQVLATVRGGGLDQDAMRLARSVLDNGGWVHVFPEAKITQQSADMPLLPFKWGVAKLLMDARVTPAVVPFFHYGKSRRIFGPVFRIRCACATRAINTGFIRDRLRQSSRLLVP
jgi:monolysocardiolipin acyltransferase